MTTHIIGAGGVASYFLSPFLRTLKHIRKPLRLRNHAVIIHDGDQLEERNLERQNFDVEDAEDALFKAIALAGDCGWYENIKVNPNYIDSSFSANDRDTIIVMADNHMARKHALEAADRAAGVTVLSAANSTIGAEAWWYDAGGMKDTRLDPRVKWPVILTDDTGSPVHAEGCNSEVHLNEVPQTPIANFMAAAHLLLLWNFVFIEKPKLDVSLTRPFWPVSFSNTATTTETTRHE